MSMPKAKEKSTQESISLTHSNNPVFALGTSEPRFDLCFAGLLLDLQSILAKVGLVAPAMHTWEARIQRVD